MNASNFKMTLQKKQEIQFQFKKIQPFYMAFVISTFSAFLNNFSSFKNYELSKGEIGVANFIPPVNGASHGNYFLPK